MSAYGGIKGKDGTNRGGGGGFKAKEDINGGSSKKQGRTI